MFRSQIDSPLNKANAHNSHGHIEIVFGPMFSGKTTELLRRIKRYQVANYSCLVIKYEKDTRYDSNAVATHDRQTFEAISCSKLSDIADIARQFEVIGVDEGQFFPDTLTFCEEMANLKKIVVVAALDGDFQRQGFGNILNLVPLAENVIKLNAVCMHCYQEAAFTKRLSNDTAREVIGGADKYMAACRDCHSRNLNLETIEEKRLKIREERKPLISIENLRSTLFRQAENTGF